MAENVFINFLSRGLKEAREASARIAKQMKEASKSLKELAPEARRQFIARQRELATERKAEIAGLQQRVNLESGYANIRGRALSSSAGLKRQVSQLKEGGETLRTAATALSASNLVAGLNLLAKVPVVGQVAAAVGAVVAIVLPIMQRELDARIAGLETRSAVEQKRALFEADVGSRFANDIEFRNKATRSAVRDELRRDAALRSGPWRRRGRYVVGE